MALKTDKYIGGQFQNLANPKIEFTIVDCDAIRAKRVLEFFIPIAYPEKPTRMMVTVEKTIFGALLGGQPLDWNVVLHIVVGKLAEKVKMGKPMPICPTSFTSTRSNKCCYKKRLSSTILDTTSSSMIAHWI